LGKVALMNHEFYNITRHPLLYKKFCLKLFHSIPPLPSSSPFNKIIPTVNNAGYGEFTQEFIKAINQDIRSLIWTPNLKTYYTPNSFYKQFDNFQGVYLKAPRVLFDGVYVMKEKYIRAGTKDLTGFYDPYHTVEFYRYLKFFPDGHVLSCLSVNKIRKEKMAILFVKPEEFSNLSEVEETVNKNSVLKSMLSGEFIVQKSRLFVKLFCNTTLYEYELEIMSSAPGFFDYLKMESQTMRQIESAHKTPLNPDFRGNKTFKFTKLKELSDAQYPL
jgi:hypothetical protein